MADRLNHTIQLTTTDAADGSPFADYTMTWSGVPYADYVAFQAILMEALGKMQAMGEEKARGKKK